MCEDSEGGCCLLHEVFLDICHHVRFRLMGNFVGLHKMTNGSENKTEFPDDEFPDDLVMGRLCHRLRLTGLNFDSEVITVGIKMKSPT